MQIIANLHQAGLATTKDYVIYVLVLNDMDVLDINPRVIVIEGMEKLVVDNYGNANMHVVVVD